MRAKLIAILFLIITSNLLRAQVSVSAKTDKDTYLIGDYIRVQLNVTADSTYVLNWPAENSVTDYELISVNPIDTIRINNAYHLSQEFVYSIYDAGNYYLPAITIPYKKFKDTSAYFATSDSVLFTIKSIEVDTTAAIKPIKEVIEVTTKNYTWVYIVCGLILLTGIGFAVYIVFFKDKTKIIRTEKLSKIPIHMLAIQLLKSLEEKKLWQNDNLKGYYSELTEILRGYLEKRFVINALESTSDEILAQLQKVAISQEQKENIRYILELADPVKFAKSKPIPNENILAMQKAYEFVEATKVIELKPEDK